MLLELLLGDCRAVLPTLPDSSVHCCVTSPPYFGLRDYKMTGQLGLEKTPAEFVENLVQVFREVRRVLRNDGTVWLNLGDSYSMSTRGKGGDGKQSTNVGSHHDRKWAIGPGLKAKDLIGIPWRVAFALQSDGWYLRQDIIWAKPNPMPESVTDRCTKSHEYIFLLTKSPRYFYDAEAIKEPVAPSQEGRVRDDVVGGVSHVERGQHSKGGSYKGSSFNRGKTGVNGNGRNQPDAARVDSEGVKENRNKRSVWTVATAPYKEAHYATFPPKLITPCILAGCPVGGTVLDPFGGSGTVGKVALELGRKAILIELNPDYAKQCDVRTTTTLGLPL